MLRIVKSKLSESETQYSCTAIATTNYYHFCESIAGQENTIYLNGSLNLFEIPETLSICDASEDTLPEGQLFFPFLFGQSFVKPIVHSKQTEAFHRFYDGLSNSDVLVILGYNLNEDDNHINAFLNEFIKNGKRIIYVTADDKSGFAENMKYRETEFSLCKVTYGNNKEVIKNLFEMIEEDI